MTARVRHLPLLAGDLRARVVASIIRLYIRGHGSWQSQTIGVWTAIEVASQLKTTSIPDVGKRHRV